MRIRHLFLVLLLIIGALGIGWFYDTRTALLTENPLQAPKNVDYYLSKVNYIAMNKLGRIRYRLQTPYLEHYIEQDISDIQQPIIDYHNNRDKWHVTAHKGSLQHTTEIFKLTQQVSLTRLNPLQPMQLDTELMIFTTLMEQIEMPQPVTVTTDKLHLKADNAWMDLSKNRYKFNQVKATYKARSDHEAG